MTGFASSGTQIVALTPKIRAANAIDWPWLPVEAVITPRSRSSALELRDEVDPAAHLERADRLVVLVLDEHLGAEQRRRAPGSRRAASARRCGAIRRRASSTSSSVGICHSIAPRPYRTAQFLEPGDRADSPSVGSCTRIAACRRARLDLRPVEALLRELEAADRFSGVVGIRRGEEDLLTGAFGYASRTWGIPMTLETRLDTASITKVFTAVATLQLVERDAFRLDTSVVEYLGLRTPGSRRPSRRTTS